MYAMIATWRMALDGVSRGKEMLAEGSCAADALESAIRMVEEREEYTSVGYGGLPNAQMQVELDAGFMDGDSLSIGAVGGIHDFASPFAIARRLSREPLNNFLVGSGAELYAHKHGFARRNMLSEAARARYMRQRQEQPLQAYAGHDTVCMIALDHCGSMCAGTSTSGLFMKHPGRVGDSPIAGSGFYADSEVGCACATGLGEEVMKGCVSYEIVRLMKQGLTPMQACEQAVMDFDHDLRRRRGSAGDMSLIAMNAQGEWGISTNIDTFSFVTSSESQPAIVWLAKRDARGKLQIKQADAAWLSAHPQE